MPVRLVEKRAFLETVSSARASHDLDPSRVALCYLEVCQSSSVRGRLPLSQLLRHGNRVREVTASPNLLPLSRDDLKVLIR